VINYPLGINQKQRTINHKNRGMSLESLINKTNDYYSFNKLALIYKKATPIKIISTNGESKITKAIFSQHSTTDYVGVYKGKYLDFEAKSTNKTTSFPMSNFQTCQIAHFKKVIEQQGLAFVIIQFTKLSKFYLLMVNEIFDFIEKTKKKSLPLSFVSTSGYEIKIKIAPPLDFLKIIDAFL
jgi:Penicillin-binding protein-related factor A, putative recombinase